MAAMLGRSRCWAVLLSFFAASLAGGEERRTGMAEI
jgi:hypothetical protein